MLRLELFGGFRLERDGVVIEPNRPKVESFFAYLALHPQEHPREKLATLFWGETSDENARNSLRQAIALVRKLIGADVLDTTRETVQLNPALEMWVDANKLGDWKSELGDSFDELYRLSSLQSLVSLYRGELLHGYSDEWIFPEREKYQQLYLDALLHLTAHYRAQSDYARVIETARRVISIDRANETAYQHLIVSHTALGERTTARALFQELTRALNEELAAEPSPETRALVAKIEHEANAPKSPHAALTNLPHPLTSFIGRARELEELKQLLMTYDAQQTDFSRLPPPSSLLTLLGPGGSGKTRLSIQVGRALVDSFAHGVWWVELAGLNDGALVPQAIARALGAQEEPNVPLLETIAEFLRERDVLLILDNCEHLIGACAHAAQFLLERAPQLKILATSREPLNIGGERAYPVPTLAMPRREPITVANLAMEFDAVKLFVERAASVNPSFRLNEQNALTVANVVQRLDGIPLAIELAAARTRALNVEQIAARLDDRFNLLTSGSRTALPRQKTLRALIDWSYNLLSEQERILFRRLGVFVGGWTLDAAEHVADANFDLLASLIDKSLVVAETNAGETRYRMLETMREYAREQLRAARELEFVQEKHLAYFLVLAENSSTRLFGAQMISTLNHLEIEHDNLRAALTFAHAQPETARTIQLAGALGDFWFLRGHLDEAERWYQELLHTDMMNVPSLPRAQLFRNAGTIAWAKADFARAQALHRRALALYQEKNDSHGIALSLNNLSIQAEMLGDLVQAQDLMQQAVMVARRSHDIHALAFCLQNLGSQKLNTDKDLAQAKIYLDESLELGLAAQDPTNIIHCSIALAEIARVEQDYARALDYLADAQPLAHELGFRQITNYLWREKGSVLALLGEYPIAQETLLQALETACHDRDRWGIGAALSRLAWFESLRGNARRAARLLAYCEAQLEKTSDDALSPNQMESMHDILARVREQLGDEIFQSEWEIGKNMSQAQAVSLAAAEFQDDAIER